MADNVEFTVNADATPPGGTFAATDELSDGSHAGIAKLAISANGDRTLIPATAADGLLVQVSNAGSGGTAETDGDAFVPDTTLGTPAMGAYEATPSTLTDGELGIVGITDDRQLKVLEENSADIEALLTTIDADTGTLAGAVAGTEVQADIVAALPAGNNNIGDVDIASLPNEGQQTMANSISVAVASNQSAIPVSGTVAVTGGLTDAELRATPVPISGTVTSNAGTNLNTSLLALEAGGNLAAIAASASVLDDWDETDRAKVNIIAGQVGVAGGTGTDSALTQRVSLATNVALPAGTNNIGDVDVLTLPSIPAGNNNIGDVDIASVPAPLSTTGGGTEATALRVTVANNSTGLLPVSGTVTANQGTAGTAWEMVGDVAADAAVPANPVSVGGRASIALPTAVSADGDSVYQWLLRNGAAVQALIPHLGMIGDPYTLTSVTAQYTSAQTSTVLINPGASQRIAVTYIQIQVGGTVGGTLQVYFGTGAYSRGTNLAIFDGEFLPSATLKPGFTASPAKPWLSVANDDDLRVTNTGTINPLTVTVWYYLIG